MTYLINPEARGVDDPSRVWDRGWCRHVPDHLFLARLLSTLLRAICQPLPPGCEFWCGRVVLLTRRAISRSSSAVSPLSTSCEGWAGACTTRFLTYMVPVRGSGHGVVPHQRPITGSRGSLLPPPYGEAGTA